MSENTNIEWCDHTWSPWRGCTKVSAGCAKCYAEGFAKRFGSAWGGWGKGAPRVLNKDWNGPVAWNRTAGNGKCDCCGSTRDASNTGNCKRCGEIDRTFTRPRVFPSLCDWLDEEVPIEHLARFLKLIHDTPNLDWLLLTKRPELFSQRMLEAQIRWQDNGATFAAIEAFQWIESWINGNPPANVWIGTSVEDQPNADERIPALLKIPARLRFLSVEPMLGPVDLSMWLPNGEADGDTTAKHNYEHPDDSIHWVIVGGESGPGARPCNVEWVRDIVRQCAAAGVPCFVKQLGAIPLDRNDRGFEGDSGPMGWPMDTQIIDDQQPGQFQGKIVRIKPRRPKGGDPDEWPEDLRVRQFPEVTP